MDINDLPHANRYGGSPEALVTQFRSVLEGAMRADAAPFRRDVTAHAHVYGRPAGAWAFDACIKLAKDTDGVCIGTRGELAAHALTSPHITAGV
jgi:hypothetical protein